MKKLSVKSILKSAWESRFIFIGIAMGTALSKLIESDPVNIILASILAVTLMLALVFIDYKLSKGRFGKYFTYRGDK